MYYEEIYSLDPIPEHLIDDLETIRSRRNMFAYPEHEHIYASYLVSDELHEFVQQQFSYPVLVRYQVIGKKLPVHLDIGVEEKYNYIIYQGGDLVMTRWWDSEHNPTNIIYETHIPQLVWHKMKVDVPHDITEVDSPRISIQVKAKPEGHVGL